LELLQEEPFRKELLNQGFTEYVFTQQFFHWQHHRNKRVRSQNEPSEDVNMKEEQDDQPIN
jgi:hypothetical protein